MCIFDFTSSAKLPSRLVASVYKVVGQTAVVYADACGSSLSLSLVKR